MADELEVVKALVPDFARDIKINLGNVLAGDASPGLSPNQIAGIALASAYATRQPAASGAMEGYARGILSPEQGEAAKAAASIMAMNNVYYRFLHLVGDKEYQGMPAKLRMMVIGNPGISKTDFELYCLAVSAINGCGACIDSHAGQLVKGGLSKEAVQSTVRIAAVISAFAQTLAIAESKT